METHRIGTLDVPSVTQFNARNVKTGKWVFPWPYRGKSACSGALNRQIKWEHHMRRNWDDPCLTHREITDIAKEDFEIVPLAFHIASQTQE